MKSKTLEYKGYLGSVDFDLEYKVLHGKLMFVTDLVTYEAQDLETLEKEFRQSVDEYLSFCMEEGVEPNKPMKGVFNVRVSPELHRSAAIASAQQDVTLNEFVRKAIEMRLENCTEVRHTHIHHVSSERVDEVFNARYTTRVSSEDMFGETIGKASVRSRH